jgi:hypothetical protein
MNGKLAKRLRQAAERATIGAPEREYEIFRRGNMMIGAEGTPIGHKPDALRLSGACTRGVYRIIKRLRARNIRLHGFARGAG